MPDKMYLRFLLSSCHVIYAQPSLKFAEYILLAGGVFVYQFWRDWKALKFFTKCWHFTFAKYYRFIRKLRHFALFPPSSTSSFHLLSPPPLCSSTPLISFLLFLSPSEQECVNIYLCLW